jgi:hypothetical protein
MNSESNSDSRRIDRSQDSLTVAESLQLAGHYRHSIIARWIALREMLFFAFENRRVSFVSTENALQHLLLNYLDDDAGAMLMEAYHLAILAEWDESILVSESDACHMCVLADTLSRAINRMVLS